MSDPTHNFDVEDFELTAEQLDEKYNPDGDGEHPHFTRSDWISAVMDGDTIQGYWSWLEHHLTLIYEGVD